MGLWRSGFKDKRFQRYWNLEQVERTQRQRTSDMFDKIPAELTFQSVYFPPFFFTVLLGFVCAWLAAKFFNFINASKFFWHPGLAFLALWVLISSLLGLTVIPP
jgi:hypothetical protein